MISAVSILGLEVQAEFDYTVTVRPHPGGHLDPPTPMEYTTQLSRILRRDGDAIIELECPGWLRSRIETSLEESDVVCEEILSEQ